MRYQRTDDPLVTVIVTTKNNHATLEACLRSVDDQSYPNMELIVVDNNSTDDTKDIGHAYTTHVFNKGPERSVQRNFGVAKARGAYVMIIDSDMVLSQAVVAACVQAAQADPTAKAIIIPEESFGKGFWAQCKKLERSFYVGQDSIEAARFFDKELYQELGGYNEAMTGGEDWDFTNRLRGSTHIGRVQPYIFHNEGRPRFTRTVRKVYYYAQHAVEYFAENPTDSLLRDKSGPLARYKLFFSRPRILLKHPFRAAGMLTLKTAEYAAGGLGYWQAKRARAQQLNGGNA